MSLIKMFTKLKTIYIFKKFAEIAQSVEQRIENPRVTSSILVLGIENLYFHFFVWIARIKNLFWLNTVSF